MCVQEERKTMQDSPPLPPSAGFNGKAVSVHPLPSVAASRLASRIPSLQAGGDGSPELIAASTGVFTLGKILVTQNPQPLSKTSSSESRLRK